jgi:hypothetical protein
MNSMRWKSMSRLATVGLVGALTAGLVEAAGAQSVGGQAYSTYVNTPLASSGQATLAVLPAVSGTDGAEADATGAALSVPGALSSSFLNSITSGELGTAEAGAQSMASAANINILNGLITADGVIANVMSSRTASGVVSNASGSTFQNLAVAGVSQPESEAPNTTVALPGVGYVVLNEQVSTGDGATSSGLTVNMIHVYLQGLTGGLLNPITGQLLGGTLSTVGEIVVGSATSSVGP